MWKHTVLAVAVALGCARADKATVYTETGLRAGEEAWDAYYREKAKECEAKHEPKTPGMEACFGKTYDADAKVAKAVQGAVAALRAYWTARAAGEKPNWAEVVEDVQAILEDLPPEALDYFERVKGLR